MRAVKFKQANVVFAKDQPEYNQLPAFKDLDGTVVSCYRLTLFERLKILFTGKVYLTLLTFNSPLQPQRLDVTNPVK